ncbi:MAG: hypothetical protein ABIR94_20585 [Rubrivivax sp.]
MYIAGDRFSFAQAAQRALAENSAGQTFFVLALPAAALALALNAPGSQAALRDRVIASNGVLLVCRRDIDNGRIDSSALVSDVVLVRGWPAAGEGGLPAGQRYFAQEDSAKLPTVNESLRSLRAACS